MGNDGGSCSQGNSTLAERITRKEKLKRLNKIIEYNFNKDNFGETTVEEEIIRKLTNDLGEPIVPHVCHILMSEFRKFMFLVGEHLIESNYANEDVAPTIEQSEISHAEKEMKSLIAPPIIDLVWVGLIKMHNVYSTFCDEIFEQYVDREFLTGTQENDYSSYNRTLQLLDKNNDILGPFINLWPNYNASCQFTDYFSFKYIHPKLLNTMIDFIKINTNKGRNPDKISKSKIKNLTGDLVQKHMMSSTVERVFRTSSESERLLNQIVDNFLSFEPLVIKLQSKLMIDKTTATNYLIEYAKYCLMVIKDPKKIYPSFTIELVWETHFEFTEVYREFSTFFFNKFIKLPSKEEFKSSKSKKKYTYTRAEYERNFGYPPDHIIWESEEKRFDENYTTRIYVNVRRLGLVQALKTTNVAFLGIPKGFKTGARNDGAAKIQILNHREDRKALAIKGKPYKWRRFYPSFSDILYEGTTKDNTRSTEEENSFEDGTADETPVKSIPADFFKYGGLVYTRDPFDIEGVTTHSFGSLLFTGFYENVQRNNMVSDLTLDDIADAYKTVHTY